MGATQRDHRTGVVLVLAQFGLIGLSLVPLGPTVGPGQRALGVACLTLAAMVGGSALLAMGAHTRIHPVPHQTTPLRTSGIYAWIRHPMYTAVLLAVTGVTLATGRILSLAALLVLLVVLWTKARFEDRLLGQRFGPEFDQYAARVPALLPAPWRRHRHRHRDTRGR